MLEKYTDKDLFSVGFGLFVILVMLIGGICSYIMTKRRFNNGACKQCGKGHYLAFDTDSSGATGYKCDNCRDILWF